MNTLMFPTDAGAALRLIYAIGDVHGRDDLLARLIDDINADLADLGHSFAQRPLLVLLGDYIDRGRQSHLVLDRLIALRESPDFETHVLLGNHEAALLYFIDGKASGRGWARFGGRATMESYGVLAPLRDDDDAGWGDARRALIARIPAGHMDLLRGMELYLIEQNLLFVHAGIRPGVPLYRQSREDLLGIRGDFLDSTEAYSHFIVHGHTPVEHPDLRSTRLNLDTGAYMTGRLTAVRLDGAFSTFLTTNALAEAPSPA